MMRCELQFCYGRVIMSIGVVICCHNRKEKTMACLRHLHQQDPTSEGIPRVYVVDDGSSDGTALAIANEFPSVTVIPGSGDLYWARAMGVGEARAIKDGVDFVVWLNDDTILERDALKVLRETSARFGDQAVIAGATSDENGSVSYTGARLAGRSPTRLRAVDPSGDDVPVDTFNGNLVWIPSTVIKKVGGIDTAFQHAYADNEFGLRCSRSGVATILAERTLASCDRNPADLRWTDRTLSRRARITLLTGRKGLPPRDHWLYIFRGSDNPVSAVWFFALSYGKALKGALL
jgi:GT2 family glycosyltransferase